MEFVPIVLSSGAVWFAAGGQSLQQAATLGGAAAVGMAASPLAAGVVPPAAGMFVPIALTQGALVVSGLRPVFSVTDTALIAAGFFLAPTVKRFIKQVKRGPEPKERSCGC